MNILKNYELTVFVGSMLLLLVLLIGINGYLPLRQHTITLTEKGFVPQKITINQGQTVIFKNQTSDAFWPASNLHPSHTIYSDFDPQRPIHVGETWEFKFDRSGFWLYHDHLHPAFTGVIEVIASGKKRATQDCQDSSLLDCLIEDLAVETATNGVGQGINKLSELYEQYPEIRQNCHDFAHVIGREAYNRYAQDDVIDLSPEVGVCGFGFYHGFIETLLTLDGDIFQASHFCRSLRERDDVVNAEQQYSSCFHGIGHGTLDVFITSQQEIVAGVEDGLELCQNISQTDHENQMCVTGLFNSLRFALSDVDTPLEYDQAAPLAICDQQLPENQPPCYGDLLAGYADVHDLRMLEGLALAEQEIPHMNDGIYTTLVDYMSAREVRVRSPQEKDIDHLAVCRQLSSAFQQTCVIAYLNGIYIQTIPATLADRFFPYCADAALFVSEKKECFTRVQSLLASLFNQEEMNAFCQDIPPLYYQESCITQDQKR